MSNDSIQVEGITKRYGAMTAVDNVSFDVGQGEFVSLLGPSGCGKTTTLRMIAGFVDPSGGLLRVRGRDVTHLPPEKRDLGFVFQNYALWPHMTVAENVAFGLKLRKKNRNFIRDKVAEALTTTGLSGMRTGCRASFRAGNSSAWRSPARWHWNRRFYSWTSRSRISTARSASPCAGNSRNSRRG